MKRSQRKEWKLSLIIFRKKSRTLLTQEVASSTCITFCQQLCYHTPFPLLGLHFVIIILLAFLHFPGGGGRVQSFNFWVHAPYSPNPTSTSDQSMLFFQTRFLDLTSTIHTHFQTCSWILFVASEAANLALPPKDIYFFIFVWKWKEVNLPIGLYGFLENHTHFHHRMQNHWYSFWHQTAQKPYPLEEHLRSLFNGAPTRGEGFTPMHKLYRFFAPVGIEINKILE